MSGKNKSHVEKEPKYGDVEPPNPQYPGQKVYIQSPLEIYTFCQYYGKYKIPNMEREMKEIKDSVSQEEFKRFADVMANLDNEVKSGKTTKEKQESIILWMFGIKLYEYYQKQVEIDECNKYINKFTPPEYK